MDVSRQCLNRWKVSLVKVLPELPFTHVPHMCDGGGGLVEPDQLLLDESVGQRK